MRMYNYLGGMCMMVLAVLALLFNIWFSTFVYYLLMIPISITGYILINYKSIKDDVKTSLIEAKK